jgi:GTP-binding protein
VRAELEAYGAGLEDKPEVIGLNKIDAMEPAALKKLATKLKRVSKANVMLLSGVGGQGVPEVLDALADAIGIQEREAAIDAGEAPDEEAKPWSPL